MEQKKTIAVLGATGETGQAVVREALQTGYRVHALARTPAKLNIEDPALKFIGGNADDLDVIVALLTGCDAVISTLGPGFDKDIARKMVCTTATGNVIQAMTQLNLKRYVVMTGASVVMPGDRTTTFANFVTRYIFPFLLGDILRDKYSEYELLKPGNLDWTLVRCPRVREKDRESSLVIQETGHSTLWVEKTAIARFLVAQVKSERYLRTGVFACSKF